MSVIIMYLYQMILVYYLRSHKVSFKNKFGLDKKN